MSNALVPVQPQAPVFTMSEMERVAIAIAKGGLFGSSDPNAVLTLCMVAQAEGKHPGLVMQQYHLINGKPAKKAEAMQVDFLASGGKIEWSQLDDEAAEATFSHPAGGSVAIRWDMARAKKAGLTSPMWGKYPRQMLRSRTISEGVRTVFPGATSGMYVPEEVAEFDDARPARPAAPQPQRARDIQADKPALEAPTPQESETKPRGLKQVVNDIVQAIQAAATVEDIDALLEGDDATKVRNEHPDRYTAINDAVRVRSEELEAS